MWVLEGVAHPGLGRKVDHAIGRGGAKDFAHRLVVSDIDAVVRIATTTFEPPEPRLFERDVVIGVQVVEPDDLVPTVEQPMGDEGTNENPPIP